MRLSTDQPGNLFAFGHKVVVALRAPRALAAKWQVTDLDGKVAAQGAAELAGGQATIEVTGLPRGYYELVAQAGSASARLAFAVISDHSATAPPSGRLNVDGATAWLERRGRHETIARMLRMAGIGWVRERFSWAGTEPQKGVVNWRQYDAVAEAFAKHGIRVYQIFHDSPAWSRAGRKNTRNPADLRDVYAFAMRLAEHYKGKVQAWEVWNEPDIFFWPDLSDTFGGVQKAAYLGFKAGDPEVLVLLGSFCRGRCAFDENLFASGIRDYFDVFNWHIYAPPEHYPATLARYLDLLRQYECHERPVWLTEAGIRLRATEPGGELNAADERRQADFVPRSVAFSLAAGNDRHFFFVLPYYLERGVQFGALRKDLSPRPAFVALAAAADILAQARFLGFMATREREGYTAIVFDSGRERVAVVWGEGPREVELAVGAKRVVVANVVGRRRPLDAPDGKLKIEIGPSPQYVIGLGPAVLRRLRGRPRPPRPGSGANPPQGQRQLSDRLEALHLSRRGVQFRKGGRGGTAGCRGARGLAGRASRGAREIGAGGQGSERVPRQAGRPVGRRPEDRRPAGLRGPAKELELGLDDPARWQKNISGNGSMEIRRGADGGVRFETRFTAAGDRWCYPRAEFRRAMDFSAWDAVAFEYRCHGDDAQTTVRLQVVEPRGTCYLTASGWRARKSWTRVVAPFADLAWGSHSPRDPNGRLDTRAVRALMIGLNTTRDAATLEVRGVRLVRLAPR